MKCRHLAFCSRSQRARATPTRPPAPNSAREREEGGSTPEAAGAGERARTGAGGRGRASDLALSSLTLPRPLSLARSLACATTRPKISLTDTTARSGDPRCPMTAHSTCLGCLGPLYKTQGQIGGDISRKGLWHSCLECPSDGRPRLPAGHSVALAASPSSPPPSSVLCTLRTLLSLPSSPLPSSPH